MFDSVKNCLYQQVTRAWIATLAMRRTPEAFGRNRAFAKRVRSSPTPSGVRIRLLTRSLTAEHTSDCHFLFLNRVRNSFVSFDNYKNNGM